MVKKIWHIIQGFYYKLTNRKEWLARKRLNVCNKCEYKKMFTLANKDIGEICSLCGCFLEMKTRVKDEYCDMNKW